MIYFWLLYQVKNDIIALNDPTNHQDHDDHYHHHVDQLKLHRSISTNNNTIVSFRMNSNHSDVNSDISNRTHSTHNNNDNNNNNNNGDNNNDINNDDGKNDYNNYNECSVNDEVIIMEKNNSNVLQHNKSKSSWIFGTSSSQKDPLSSTSSSSSSSLSHHRSQSISQKQSSAPITHINEIGGNSTDECLSDPMSAASFYHFSKKHSNKSSYNDDNNNTHHHRISIDNDFDYSSNIDPSVPNSAKTLKNSIKINNIYSTPNDNNDYNNIHNDDINDNNINNNNNNNNNNNTVVTNKTKLSPKPIHRLQRKKTYLLIFEVKSVRFLWEPYRGIFWYWEVVECYRRIILTAGTLQ